MNAVLRNRIKRNYLAMPEKIRKAIWSVSKKYKDEGYECYLVGGSCRDLLLNEIPYDYDFATNCPLAVSKKIFKKYITVGESHGTLIVFYAGYQFEITRYRKDVKTDGRRATIEYSESIEEDQRRRDLRLNALAYDVIENVIVDSQNGLLDVEEKKIRFVGKARERILEDHLRALRYARLIAKLQPLGFTYDRDEMAAVIQVFDSGALSIERIYDELEKILSVSQNAKDFLLSYLPRLRIFDRFLNDSQTADRVIHDIINTRSLLPLPYQYLKNHSMKQAVEELRLSRETRRLLRIVMTLSEKNLDDPIVMKDMLHSAANIEINRLVSAVYVLLGKDIQASVDSIVTQGVPYRLKDLKLSGDHLTDMGFRGVEVGKTLKALLRKVWENPSLNDQSILEELARQQKRDAR